MKVKKSIIFTPTKYICLQCGKHFIDSKFEKRKFCSLSCKYKLQKQQFAKERIGRFERNEYCWYGSSIILKSSGLVKVPKGKIPHHIDGNSKNNHQENLMFVTEGQNRIIHAHAYRFIVAKSLTTEYLRWISESQEFRRRSR